jgi:KUP system potassium uptake protein
MMMAEAQERSLVGSALAGLGIVFGDLGTSPLYTMQTIVGAVGGDPGAAALGVLSLIVWALIISVSIKYCLLVMRADNHGEGGILALMSLLGLNRVSLKLPVLAACGLFGAALIYGDGAITPAISVLSALEGINVVTAVFKPYVMPGAVVILVLLFAAQAMGTAKIGRVFGPIMLLWFVVIAVLGLINLLSHPGVLWALNPGVGLRFLAGHGWGGFAVLGGVFLAITGGEALYADMGHIGREPIRISWYGVVLPALVLCYAGQAALMIEQPKMEGNPFFHLPPDWAVIPLVILATAATIIASQAIITGSFSLTRQAMQTGWFPGLSIRQTSDREYGQIYVPFVNWSLMLVTVALTVIFRSSDSLAGAYGTAVSTTMMLTTTLLYNVMRDRWGWNIWAAALVSGVLLIVDIAFFAANLMKIADGGWIPLTLGVLIFLAMTTWRKGVDAVRLRAAPVSETPEEFLALLQREGTPRTAGTAVFLNRSRRAVPALAVRHVKQFGSLPETVVSLMVEFDEAPRVAPDERVEVQKLAEGLWRLVVRFGFIEVPNLGLALEAARDKGCEIDVSQALFFAAHDEVVRGQKPPLLVGWRRKLFAFMFRNAVRAVDRFDLPRERFIEVGRQVEI